MMAAPTQLTIRPSDVQAKIDTILPPLEQQYDLPSGILEGILNQEDKNMDPNATSDGIHVGPFQQSPDFAKQYGVEDRTSLAQSAEGTAKFLRDRLDANDQDLSKTLAEYNWGLGNVAKHGLENMPAETRNYIDGINKTTGMGLARPLSDAEISQMGSTPPTTDAPTPSITVANPQANKAAAGSGELSDAEIFGLSIPSTTITPSTHEDDVIKAFGMDPTEIKASPIYQPGMFSGANQLQHENTMLAGQGSSWVGTLLRGAQDVPEAVGQIEGHLETALGSNPANQKVRDLQTMIDSQVFDQVLKGRQPGETAPWGESILRGVGSMAVPIPGSGALFTGASAATKAAIKGTSVFSKFGRAAAPAAITGAAVAPLASPVTDPNDTDNFATAKGGQAKAGAEGGALMGPPLTAAGTALVKGMNAVKGVMPDAYNELKAVADKYNMWDKLSVGNISGDKTAQHIEHSMRILPEIFGGTAGQADKLKAATGAAAEKYSGELYDKMINSNFKNVADIQKAAVNPGDSRSGAAKRVLEMMNNNDDFNKIMSASKSAVDVRSALISDKNYAKVESLAGNSNAWVVNTNKAVDTAIKELKEVKGGFADRALGLMQRIKDDLNNPKLPNTYFALRKTRTALESAASDMRTNGDKFTASQLEDVSSNIKADLDAFGTNSKRPDLKAAATRADNFFKNKIIPLQAKELNTMTYAENPAQMDKVYGSIIKAGRSGGLAQMAYNALDNKGRAAVRYGMVDEAMRRATDEEGGFNPKKFSQYLHNVQETRGVFMKGTDKWQMDGFINLMNHAASSKEATNSHFLLGAILGEGMLGRLKEAGTGALLGATGSAAAVRWLLTSPTGKRLLLASAEVRPGSPAMAKVVDKIRLQLPNLSGNISGNKEQGQ